METHARAGEPREGWFVRWRRSAPPVELPEVSRFWCLMLGLLALACLGITIDSNVQLAGKVGLTAHGKQTLMAQAMVIDGFALALVAVSGSLWFSRRWIASLGLLVFAGGYVILS